MEKNSIILVKNKQKASHETWHGDRNLADLPCPSRILLASSPNGGKTSVCLNLIMRANPPYQKIFLSHPSLLVSGDTEPDEDGQEIDEYDDGEPVEEYKSLDYIPVHGIPPPTYFDNGCKKQLWVVDDLEMKTLNKVDKANLNKCLSFASTHFNLSIIVTTQDPFTQLPVCVLRFINFACLWKYNNLSYMRMVLNRLGIGKKQTEKIIEEMAPYNTHDFLTLDNTVNAPHRFRRNLFTPLPQLEN